MKVPSALRNHVWVAGKINGEHYECAADEQFVDERIGDAAKGRLKMIFSRYVSIQPIGQYCKKEYHQRRQIPAKRYDNEKHDREKNAREGQKIGRVDERRIAMLCLRHKIAAQETMYD